MPTRTSNIKTILRLSVCLLLCLLIVSCNRTGNSTQLEPSTNSTHSNSELETANTTDTNEWLLPILSQYLQDDGNTPPADPKITVFKGGNGSGDVSSSPSGISCGVTCSSTYDANTVVTLTAVADSGSSFTSWSGCTSTNNNTCTVTVNGLTNVTATFTSTLTYQGFYITQAAQNFNNTAALADNRKSYARLFLTQSGTDHTALDVDLHISTGGNTLKIDLTGPGTAPTSYSEGDLSTSYNAYIPAIWIQTDTTYYVTISSALGTNIIRNPTTGSLSQNVKSTPQLEVVWVPVIYNNGPVPSMTAAARETLLQSTREFWPVVDVTQSVRASYTFNQALEGQTAGSGWSTLLREISLLKNADGAASNVYYHAIVDNAAFISGSGIYGIAYRPGTIAVSREHTETIAHEWGHNWNRRHVAGCNNPSNTDPSYPHSSGSIGVWGINVFDDSLALKSPNTWRDTMTYCDVDWSSDYNYDAIANYRSTDTSIIDNRVKQLVLMVSGSISSDGQATLDPAFSLEALPDFPNIGAYTVQLISTSNNLLAELNFDSMEIDHSDERHFFVNVPITQELLNNLATIRILDSNGNVIVERNNAELLTLQSGDQSTDASPLTINQTESSLNLSWDTTLYPKVLIKDSIAGSVIAMSVTGSVSINKQSLLGTDLEVLLSNDVSSSTVVVKLEE